MERESYLTIKGKAEGLYKEKGSKFIALAYPVETEEEFNAILAEVKQEFYNARHHCYAYRIDPEKERFRANDDGEPSGSAGKPILNQIFSHELFNVLIIVVRYFGGTKLGVSGLINAYKMASKDALNEASIVQKHLTKSYLLTFDYPQMNDVMRVIKEEKTEVTKHDFSERCVIQIVVKKNVIKQTIFRLQRIRNLDIKAL